MLAIFGVKTGFKGMRQTESRSLLKEDSALGRSDPVAIGRQFPAESWL